VVALFVMPILIALLVAILISGIVFGLAARHGRLSEAVDVHADRAAVAEVAEKHGWIRQFLDDRRDASKATGLLLTIAVGAVALITVLIGSVLEMVQTHQGFARFDNSAARFGAHHATQETTRVLKAITQLGSTPVVIAIVIVIGLQQFITHRKKALPLFLATTVVLAVVLGNVIKTLVHRARPDVDRLVAAHGSSFPSGHTTAAAATYAALALLFGRNRSRKVQALLVGVAAAIAVAVAASRVLLGVHWLTDVIAGLLLGWGCFALVSIAFGGRVMHFGEPVENAQDAAEAADGSQPVSGGDEDWDTDPDPSMSRHHAAHHTGGKRA